MQTEAMKLKEEIVMNEMKPVECDQWWRCLDSRLPSWAASASGAAAFLSSYQPLTSYISLSFMIINIRY